MFAVIKTGGKQYKVQAGDLVKVEKLDAEEGKTIKISDVLMLIDGDKTTIGTPNVKGATVSAKINSHGRGPKIKIIKFEFRAAEAICIRASPVITQRDGHTTITVVPIVILQLTTKTA